MQECGRRQLYCMRGSLCACTASALRSCLFLEERNCAGRRKPQALMELGARYPSPGRPLPGALPGTSQEVGEAEEAKRNEGLL